MTTVALGFGTLEVPSAVGESNRPVISDTGLASPRRGLVELKLEIWPEHGAEYLLRYVPVNDAWNGWDASAAKLTRRGRQSSGRGENPGVRAGGFRVRPLFWFAL